MHNATIAASTFNNFFAASWATAWADPARAPRAWPLPAGPLPFPQLDTAADDAGFGETAWVDLDDQADAEDSLAEADRADAQLLGAVGCAAFATLVLAVVSSLPVTSGLLF